MDTRICEFFKANSDDMARDIAALVAIDSAKGAPEEGAPYGKGPRAALTEAKRIAESWGLSAEIRGDRVCVVELGEGEPELGMLAHLDIVPAAGDWKVTKPFDMKLQDGILYGRGVADNKGPAVTSIYALRAIKELNIPISHKVQLILGSDEENGSDDIKWYLKNYKMPPKVFTPDGAFPLVNTEKGKLDMTVSLAPQAESTGAHVVSMKGGSVANAVPDICETVIKGVAADNIKKAAGSVSGRIEIFEETDAVRVVCHGKASHASVPSGGVNAIKMMLTLISSLELDNTPEFSAICALIKALPFGDDGGRAIGADCCDDVSGALTMNLGVISFSAENGFRALIDCRVPVCGDGNAIAEALKEAIGDSAQVTVTGLLKPHNVPETSDFVKGLLRIYEDHTGEKGKALAIGGLTYVHEVEGGVAFGCEFPGRELHGHEPDECMPFADLVIAGQMFAQAIADFCG
ncbi:MAG: Sapep family Mn(2+)-dependent dipeptidase [Oscillospiraceae bacterium]